MRERELFVAIPADRHEMDPRTGAGRVWSSVLAELERHIRVEPLEVSGRAGFTKWRVRPPDVWLTPGPESAISPKEPVVAVIHGSAWTVEASFWGLVPREFAERMVTATEAALGSASYIITPSEYTRRGLTEHYPGLEDRVFAVPHGVDSRVFNPDGAGGREIVEASLGERRPYVLFASIPSIQQKNLPSLRKAIGRLVERGFPHALVIAGGTAGGESAALLASIGEDLPQGRGRVAWLGAVDDRQLSALMAGADAFCLPSYFESFGLTALEAMASGAPVIVSNRGALPEVVGEAGLVCEPTPEALEQALAEVLTDRGLADRLRASGRARAERMTWAGTAEGWLAVLRRGACWS